VFVQLLQIGCIICSIDWMAFFLDL